jgi:condensin complex subunit 1
MVTSNGSDANGVIQILNEHQAKGLEEQALEADVLKKTKAAKRKAAKRPPTAIANKGRGGGRSRRNKPDSEEEEEELVEAVEEKEEVEMPTAKQGRGKGAPARRGLYLTSYPKPG